MADIRSGDYNSLHYINDEQGIDTTNITALCFQEGTNPAVSVWAQDYTYATGTLPTGVASLVCTRAETPYSEYAGATIGPVDNGGTLYYGDKIYFTATAATGYNDPTCTYTPSNKLSVASNVTGSTYVTAGSAKVYTIQAYSRTGGTVTWSKTQSGTYSTTLADVSYGSTVWWKITPDTEYNAPATSSGSMTLNTTNFSLGGSGSNLTASYIGNAIGNCTRKTFVITFAMGGTSSGSWSSATITAQYGDTMSRSGNVVTIKKWDDVNTNRGTSTFTPTTGYDVSYSSITSPITSAQTITATTARQTFTITFAKGGSNYGSWSTASIAVEYGDTIARSGDVVTISKWNDSTTRGTSTFTNGSATGYTYSVSYNSVTSPITASQTVTATTSRTANDYNITITKNTGISTIYYKVNGASSWTSTTASTTVSAKYDSTVYWYAEAATEYNGNNVGSSSSPNSFTMGTSGTIAPTATRKSFSITIALTKGTGDSTSAWDSTTSITAYYGDWIQRSGNVITIYQWDATTTARATRTLTLDSAYNASYSNAPTTKTQLNRNTTYAVSATTSRKTFSITIGLTKGTGDSTSAWDSTTSITAYYGDYIQRSGNVVTIYQWDATTTARATRTLTLNAAYNASYTNAPTTKTQLNRDTTLAVSATTSRKSFSITIALTRGTGDSTSAWDSTTSITAYYGDYIQRSGNVITIYKWDATTTARATRTLTVDGAYTASYTNAPTTKTQLNRSSTLAVSATTTRASFTITLNKDAHPNSTWSKSTITAYYGDWIQRNGNVVTIYKWDANTTARDSSTFSNSSNPDTVWYNANAPTTKTQLNRTTAYSLSCVTGWTITYAGSNGTWKRNGTASTTLTAYYGDQVSISTTTSSVTVTIYIGTDTSRIRDTYARIFTPSSGYNVSGCTSLSTVTGRHTITASTQATSATITFQLSGSYAAVYQGTLRCTSGSAYGTQVWSGYVSSGTSSGTTITGSPNPLTLPVSSSTTYYFGSSDIYDQGIFQYYVSSSSFTVDSAGNKTVTVTISRRRALACQNPGCLGNEGYN